MIWQACNGSEQFRELKGTLYRLVESQEQVATMGYVDTLAEQALLEEMLDQIKPPFPDNTLQYHYLLKTPFRYPPLKWGSRFGRTHEQGIFYGALSTQVALAESAFYRFIFWHSMDSSSIDAESQMPVNKPLRSAHTLFTVDYQSDSGICLHCPPFDQYSDALTDVQEYSQTQAIGSAMREANVHVFEYTSARDPDRGVCAGVFNVDAFVQSAPVNMRQWLCELTADQVAYKQIGQTAVMHFTREQFLVNGQLPMPAS